MTPEMEREEAVAELCVRKCTDLDTAGSLRNHKTGWNALKNIREPHKSNLKRMGYSIVENSFRDWQKKNDKFGKI